MEYFIAYLLVGLCVGLFFAFVWAKKDMKDFNYVRETTKELSFLVIIFVVILWPVVLIGMLFEEFLEIFFNEIETRYKK